MNVVSIFSSVPRICRSLATMTSVSTGRTIGTHNGAFHCDEALGCWMLKKTNRFRNAEIVRSRDPDTLKTLDVVIDVGGVYNPDELRFDHHQRGFAEVFGHGHSIKLSSAGLTYKHFGKEVLAHIIHPLELSEVDMESLYLKVYEGFVKAVDGIDNGINPWEGDTEPKYVDSTTLAYRVSRLNPAWNETSTSITETTQFNLAMQMCGEEFTSYALEIAKRWLPARSYVLDAIKKRFSVHDSGEIILVEPYCPWKAHLLDLEIEMNLKGVIKYCTYNSGEDYRVQAVPVNPGSFESRLLLPSEWRALRFAELDAASGIKGCVFVHNSGFVGGNKTKEGALQMAQRALELSKQKSAQF